LDDTTQYEKEQERKEAWEHEMNSIASRIKNTEVGASIYHASSRLFGAGKDVPDIVRHHLDWIQYHTRKIAEEIGKKEGDMHDLLVVTQPEAFIANEELDAEIRDMVMAPMSARWETPPLPGIILNRLKHECVNKQP
jgi:hypothetical protein